MEKHTADVSRHYDAEDIAERILEAVESTGVAPDAITIDHLAPADEVHTRGREATVELAELAGIEPGLDIVDVGSGVGGPARYLASVLGCRVSGVDLTPGFVTAANRLTRAVGLEEQARFVCASALEMPFDDASFDLAWTVQVQMNIANKAAFYREIARVLRPGGRLVFQDIVAGEVEGLLYPVPWASAPAHSHLVPPGALREAVEAAGFEAIEWREVTDMHRAWTEAQARRAPAANAPAVGVHLVLGADAFEKRRNSSRCLLDGRIGFVRGVFRKVSAGDRGASARRDGARRRRALP